MLNFFFQKKKVVFKISKTCTLFTHVFIALCSPFVSLPKVKNIKINIIYIYDSIFSKENLQLKEK